MSLEENIRKIVAEEIEKRQPGDIVPVSQFCKDKKISRTAIWKGEKEGRVKLTRIGRRIFINTNQFIAA